MGVYHWHRYTASESMQRISVQHEVPWVAVGDFLDDWRRSAKEDRVALVREPLASVIPPELQQWAAFFAAAVEELCLQDGLPVPEWTLEQQYILPEPWYVEARTQPLRELQEKTTPDTFKHRNILGGDRMLSRV